MRPSMLYSLPGPQGRAAGVKKLMWIQPPMWLQRVNPHLGSERDGSFPSVAGVRPTMNA